MIGVTYRLHGYFAIVLIDLGEENTQAHSAIVNVYTTICRIFLAIFYSLDLLRFFCANCLDRLAKSWWIMQAICGI